MFKKLWELAATLLTLARDLQQYRQEQERIRRDLADVVTLVSLLSQDIKNSKEQSQQRHANLLLELENRLLKYERMLPAAEAGKSTPKKDSKK
jgi:archaellum component FlaC